MAICFLMLRVSTISKAAKHFVAITKQAWQVPSHGFKLSVGSKFFMASNKEKSLEEIFLHLDILILGASYSSLSGEFCKERTLFEGWQGTEKGYRHQ